MPSKHSLRIHTSKPTALVGEADLLVDTNPELAAIYTPLYPLAEAILPLAQAQVEKGNALPVTEVDLVYLRGAEAWQKRKRLRRRVLWICFKRYGLQLFKD